MPKISVVILNYNGINHLKEFLPSVINYSQGAELVVIDNGSQDDSISFLEQYHAEIKIISLPENLGFCEGYNQGTSSLDADYFVFLNSDVEVTENWLSPCINLMEKDITVGACQPKILSWKEKQSFEYAGAAGGFIDWLGFPFCRGRIFNSLEIDKGQYNEAIPVFWASGACLFIRANIFRDLEGFDVRFFAHMEEIDLCWRIQNSGFRIFCNPESVVYHLGGGTLSKSDSQKTYLNYKNNLLTILKNTTVSQRMIVIPVRLFLDLIAVFVFTINSGIGHGIAIIRAYSTILFQRPVARPKPGIKLLGIYPKSIVFSHYIKRIKKFSNLRFD